jgi:NTP pyrophosphatase (non-canonical NTP hydrolase)
MRRHDQEGAQMTSVVSAEVSAGDLSRALDGFTAAIGADRVLTDEADLREFRDPFAYESWDDYTASAVVMPETVEEIQEIVRVANQHKIPLWTHGTGRNNGYGGPAPRVRGSVILSLRRMNRVLEIDEELGYAVVEPGVRWFDLYEAIQAGGHKLMLSVPDLGWGSVVGNTLDHGITYLRNGHGRAVRDGGRAPKRGSDAHRHGRDAGQPIVEPLQARPRPDARPALHAVELRHRHEDGHLADAEPGVLHAPLATRLA